MKDREYILAEIKYLREWIDDCEEASEVATREAEDAQITLNNLELVLQIGEPEEIKALAKKLLEARKVHEAMHDAEQETFELPKLTGKPNKGLN